MFIYIKWLRLGWRIIRLHVREDKATQDGSADCAYMTLVDIINMNCEGNSAPWTCAVHNIDNNQQQSWERALWERNICVKIFMARKS